MKIYFVIFNIYGMGGTVRTVLNTTNYLAEKGYDIEIISMFRRQKNPFFEINNKIKITVLHDTYSRGKNRKDLKSKIINFIDRRDSILIHKNEEAINQFSLLTDLKLYFYLKSLEKGIIISTRPSLNLFIAKHAPKNLIKVGQEHINFESHSEKLKKSINKFYSKLDYIITLTDKDNDNYSQIFKEKNVEVKKITNSVIKTSGEKSDLSKKVIMTAGRLNPVKRYDLLIKAFSQLVEEHPDWKLKIYGSGGEKNDLIELIQSEQLYNHVYLMGSSDNIEENLLDSSIFTISSREEGFGLVIVEAMQVGVPVVSFNCPHGPAEIINNGEDGLLIENGDVEGLAEGMKLLIEDKNLRLKMGKKAITNSQRFSVDTIGKQWEEFINSFT